MKTILFLIIVTQFLACDPVQTINMTNKSDKTVFFIVSFDQSFTNYPISFSSESQDTLWENMSYLTSNDNSKLPVIGRKGWETNMIKRSSDTSITIFYFEKEILLSGNKDSILSNQIFSKKVKYKLKDLENLDWQIEYP